MYIFGLKGTFSPSGNGMPAAGWADGWNFPCKDTGKNSLPVCRFRVNAAFLVFLNSKSRLFSLCREKK